MKPRKMGCVEHAMLMEKMRNMNMQEILVGKPEEPLERPRHGWRASHVHSFYRNKLGGHGLDSCGSEQGSLAGSFEHDNEP